MTDNPGGDVLSLEHLAGRVDDLGSRLAAVDGDVRDDVKPGLAEAAGFVHTLKVALVVLAMAPVVLTGLALAVVGIFGPWIQ